MNWPLEWIGPNAAVIAHEVLLFVMLLAVISWLAIECINECIRSYKRWKRDRRWKRRWQ